MILLCMAIILTTLLPSYSLLLSFRKPVVMIVAFTRNYCTVLLSLLKCNTAVQIVLQFIVLAELCLTITQHEWAETCCCGQAVISRSSIIRSSLSCSLSLWTRALKPSTSWLECVLSVWALWKAGVQSTGICTTEFACNSVIPNYKPSAIITMISAWNCFTCFSCNQLKMW